MQQNMTEQNIIITESSKNLRALGRNALAGKWNLGMLAVIIYTLSLQVPVTILNTIFGGRINDLAFDISAGAEAYTSIADSSFLSDVYTILVSGALELGVSLFFLALFRKQMVNATDVFLGFEKFGKALGLLLFQALFIFLWTMLFIIPGIIAAIRYSQAFFVLADNPDMSIRQCMDASKMMMSGNKAKYFCLSFSFIGWLLLTVIPMVVMFSIILAFDPSPSASPSAVVTIIITLIAVLFTVPVSVYMYSTFAGFYEILAGHLIKETAPAPIMPELASAVDPDKQDDDDDFFIPKQV